MKPTVLSLFPGGGLLDLGFEKAGFSVLRGPDLLFNRDIRDFDATPWAGKIDGVIGGVPCQKFSVCTQKKNRDKHFNLWPEFWRIYRETRARRALGECVKGAGRLIAEAQSRVTRITWISAGTKWSYLGVSKHRYLPENDK